MMFMVQPGGTTTFADAVGWSVDSSEQEASAAAAAHGGSSAPDALLARALEAERAAASRRSPWALGPAPAVLEVSAAQLTAGRDKLVATKSVTGLAFGDGYEAKLRAEAGMKPSDTARRKHQIGSLLHDAKMREIEMLEGRLTAMKTKRETQARYGW
jgi:proline-rich protein PRCC